MKSTTLLSVLGIVVVAWGCGDDAPAPEDGTPAGVGGSAASTGTGGDELMGQPTSQSSSSFASSGVGGGCAVLGELYLEALLDAAACDASASENPCTGPAVHDPCGCLVHISPDHAPEAPNVEGLYDKWTEAGCGPNDCPPCGDPRQSYCGSPPDVYTGSCTPYP